LKTNHEGKPFYFHCPKCENDTHFSEMNQQVDGGAWGCALLFFAPILLPFFLGDLLAARVQCSQCGFVFRRPPMPRSVLANFVLLSFALLLLGAIAITVLIHSPEILVQLPEYSVLSWLEAVIANHSRAVLWGALSLFAFWVLTAIVWAVTDNLQHHRRLREQFRSQPDPFRPASPPVEGSVASAPPPVTPGEERPPPPAAD